MLVDLILQEFTWNPDLGLHQTSTCCAAPLVVRDKVDLRDLNHGFDKGLTGSAASHDTGLWALYADLSAPTGLFLTHYLI